MARKDRILKALAMLLPAGAIGASVALASAASGALPLPGSPAADERNVAERLQAIRTGVSAMAADAKAQSDTNPDVKLAWWGNGGVGPWHFGWGNGGGWHNGGWRNWGNGWHNGGWHNWGNGWHNGWHNFWRNW
jgi:rSAM-associated Gly-rich repeat protein